VQRRPSGASEQAVPNRDRLDPRIHDRVTGVGSRAARDGLGETHVFHRVEPDARIKATAVRFRLL